jgi:hypothetical protein
MSIDNLPPHQPPTTTAQQQRAEIASTKRVQNTSAQVTTSADDSDSFITQSADDHNVTTQSGVNPKQQRILKLSITVDDPSYLLVKEQDTVKIGQVISDNTLERNRLNRNRQSISLQIQNLKSRQILEPTPPKPVAKTAPVPDANFAEEEAAIAQAQMRLTQAQSLLASRTPLLKADNPERRAEMEKAEASVAAAVSKVESQQELLQAMKDMKVQDEIITHEQAVLKRRQTELDQSKSALLQATAKLEASAIEQSRAGDINDDGIDDIIIGAPSANRGYGGSGGQSYVVFGSANVGSDGSIELSTLNGTNGFVLNGNPLLLGDRSGSSVSDAGDINGDGIDDIIIGAPNASYLNSRNGRSYVVFGGANVGSNGSIELSTLDGTNGFAINGIARVSFSGTSVSGARDINGDHIDDVIIGAPFASPNGNFSAGQSYVVFGASTIGSGGNIDLSTLDGANGFALNGIAGGDYSGNSVSLAGDINGDGIDDIVIGAPEASSGISRFIPGSPFGPRLSGQSYVIYGNASPTLDLNTATPGIDFTTTFSASPVPITANPSISDNNSSSLNSATITITNPLDSVAEVLTANTENTSITANYNPVNGTLTLTGTDTIANYQQVLQTVTYNNLIAASSTTERTIEFFVNDGGANGISQLATTNLSINANTNIVDGTPGRDTLNGTPVNDRIAGDSGADILTGGGGNNAFVYNNIRDSGDTITDFEVGADVILLSRNLFQAPPDFNYDIATSTGFLGFRTQGNDTTILIDADGTAGSALPTPLVRVSGVAVSDLASAGNFVL